MVGKTLTSIDLREWNDLVKAAYNRPYNLQQQRGCIGRGVEEFTVPGPAYDIDEPLVIGGVEMGVTFAEWLDATPPSPEDWEGEMDWEREFYPDISMVANDLYARGIIKPGDHQVVIDW